MGMFAQAEENANLGRVEDFDANIAGLRKAAASAPDAQTQLQLHNMANQAAGGRDNVVAKNTQVQVGNIAKIDGILGDEGAVQKLDPRAAAAMKEARNKIYAQPEVRKAYDAQKLKEVQTTADTTRAQGFIDDKNIRKQYGQLKASGNTQALAAFEKQVDKAGNGFIIDNIKMEQGQQEQFDMEMAEMRADLNRPAKVPAALAGLMDGLADVPQAEPLRKAYDGLKQQIQDYNDSKGTTSSGEVFSGETLKRIDSMSNQLFASANNIASSKNTARSVELTGYQKQVVKAKEEIATIAGSISDTDIEAKAKSLLGQGSTRWGGTSAEDNIYETNVTYGGEELTAYEAAKRFLIDERTEGFQESLRIAEDGISRLSGPSDFDTFMEALQKAEAEAK
jgi:hypothetical protein